MSIGRQHGNLAEGGLDLYTAISVVRPAYFNAGRLFVI
jgi:hypothetical protein